MKRLLVFIIAAASLFSFAGCGQRADEDFSAEPTEASSGKIIPDRVDENSPEAKAVREAAANMLDTFISADFDAIAEILVDEDEGYFNFNSEQQREFYASIFPKIKYEFDYVAEHDGVYGVMTKISSPDMAHLYGDMLLDLMENDSSASEEEMRDENTRKMKKILNSNDGSVSTREEELFIYVEKLDGKYVVRCDSYLANELIGGAAEAAGEIVSSVTDTINALGE